MTIIFCFDEIFMPASAVYTLIMQLVIPPVAAHVLFPRFPGVTVLLLFFQQRILFSS